MNKSPETKNHFIAKSMKFRTLTSPPFPSTSTHQDTHDSIHQSIHIHIHIHIQQHPANPPPPTQQHRPTTMTIPTFSCHHQLLPIPPHTSYPPPRTLPFPCRTCHMTATTATDARIRARFEPSIRELDRQIGLGEEKLWYQYEELLANRLEVVRGQRRDYKARMEYELRECWREFDARWGGPMQ